MKKVAMTVRIDLEVPDDFDESGLCIDLDFDQLALAISDMDGKCVQDSEELSVTGYCTEDVSEVHA
jgi:hypothetical protein